MRACCKLVQEPIHLLPQPAQSCANRCTYNWSCRNQRHSFSIGFSHGAYVGNHTGSSRGSSPRRSTSGWLMDRPVVLRHVQPPDAAVDLVQPSIEPDQLLAPHNVVLQIIHPTRQRIQRPNHAPLLVIRPCPLRHRAGAGAIAPSLQRRRASGSSPSHPGTPGRLLGSLAASRRQPSRWASFGAILRVGADWRSAVHRCRRNPAEFQKLLSPRHVTVSRTLLRCG